MIITTTPGTGWSRRTCTTKLKLKKNKIIITTTTRDWVVEKGLYNYPTTCKEPERLSDKMWDMVSSTEFACKVILFNHPNAMKSFDHTINQK